MSLGEGTVEYWQWHAMYCVSIQELRQIRTGQFLVTHLREYRPDLTLPISVDCFYNDSKIGVALQWIAANW